LSHDVFKCAGDKKIE
jgi:hypothetical protein